MNTKGAWAAFVAAALLLGACGQATPGTGHSSATPALTPATAQQLTAVGAQIFPYIPQFQFYATCIDFKENGAAPPGGHDYSARPITDALRARLQATQANFCPCEQNPSTTREIKVTPRPGGGLIIVQLYGRVIKVEMVAINRGGKLLVNDLPGKGDVENGSSTPIDFDPKPTPTPTAPPLPTAPPGTGSRVLKVPSYRQVYVLSCESAALRMALAFEGIATTDKAVLDIIGSDPRGPVFDSSGMHWGDPFATFVGNVNGSEIALTGYGVYYPPIAHAAMVLGGHVLRSRSEEHTSELQSRFDLVCRLLLEKKNINELSFHPSRPSLFLLALSTVPPLSIFAQSACDLPPIPLPPAPPAPLHTFSIYSPSLTC